MAKRVYTEEDRALVQHFLDVTEGNVKRTSRETGVPEQTVRDWKKQWERSGGPSTELVEARPAAVEKHTGKINRVREKLVDRIESMVDDRTSKATIKDLATTYGILTDKVRLSEGKPTSRTEHSGAGMGSLPVEQVRELFSNLARGMIDATQERRDTISSALGEEEPIDAEWTEQAPEALPASASV